MKLTLDRWLAPAALLGAAPLLALAQDAAPPSTAPAAKDTPADVRNVPQARTVAFVGIGTGSVDPVLASHLGTGEGMGLTVQLVVEDSPAQAAGIQANDVLVKFDDQLLVNTAQLTALIQNKMPGDAVNFTLFRKGEQQVVEVELGEQTLRPAAMLRLIEQEGQPLRWRALEAPWPEFEVREEEMMRAMEEELARLRENLGEVPEIPMRLRRFQPAHRPDAPAAPFVADGAVVVSDKQPDGTAATLKRDGDGLWFQFKQNGEVLFEGPVGTDAQREKLTDEQRARLETLQEMMPVFEESGPKAMGRREALEL